MKKILLTGGNGFFGTRLADFYRGKYEVIVTDKDDLDIVNEEEVVNAFKEIKPDFVIHAAAIAVTDFCNKHPELAYKINVQGAINVAKACKEVGAKMVFISSEQVFNGNDNRGPFNEESTPVPNTVYGENKLEAEKLVKDILDEVWVLRFTWQFGLPQRGFNMASNILWDTMTAIMKGEKIIALTNEFRGMTYVYELIEQFDKIFEIPYDTYHVGSVNNLSRYEVVKFIIKQLGLEHRTEEILEADTEKYSDNPRDVRLDTSKLARFGIKFGTTEEGIVRCLNEFKIKL
ncbi:NAD(P)-dependent oxidoreductase [Clostridium zeae]|uniref:dTDP-4-dehydrorhamnose reductase n=1 Tax=Clostridium zeae TaxID=2759022 RepID=A0ABQ1EBP5_9CLOT|nr:NAD(P)-dependent oxidoreductase [Clostridium zeae]GFZ32156.1 NAD(P)-dependent oxidoreductase [Clostridium zeae]